jgi:hypothetical protein
MAYLPSRKILPDHPLLGKGIRKLYGLKVYPLIPITAAEDITGVDDLRLSPCPDQTHAVFPPGVRFGHGPEKISGNLLDI